MGRFAVSLLDIKNKNKAKPEEILIDKKTGQLFINRGTEVGHPSLISYDSNSRAELLKSDMLDVSARILGCLSPEITTILDKPVVISSVPHNTVSCSGYIGPYNINFSGYNKFIVFIDMMLYGTYGEHIYPILSNDLGFDIKVEVMEFTNPLRTYTGKNTRESIMQRVFYANNYLDPGIGEEEPTFNDASISVEISNISMSNINRMCVIYGIYLVSIPPTMLESYTELEVSEILSNKNITEFKKNVSYKKGNVVFTSPDPFTSANPMKKFYMALSDTIGVTTDNVDVWKPLNNNDVNILGSAGNGLVLYKPSEMPSDNTKLPEIYGVISNSSKMLYVNIDKNDDIFNIFS